MITNPVDVAQMPGASLLLAALWAVIEVDGIEGWRNRGFDGVADALAAIPPEVWRWIGPQP